MGTASTRTSENETRPRGASVGRGEDCRTGGHLRGSATAEEKILLRRRAVLVGDCTLEVEEGALSQRPLYSNRGWKRYHEVTTTDRLLREKWTQRLAKRAREQDAESMESKERMNGHGKGVGDTTLLFYFLDHLVCVCAFFMQDVGTYTVLPLSHLSVHVVSPVDELMKT